MDPLILAARSMTTLSTNLTKDSFNERRRSAASHEPDRSGVCAKNLIPTDQIGSLIASIHSTLSGLGNEIVEELPRVPAVSIRRSVRAASIICIECGFKGQMIKRHLQLRHGLSIAQYKTRWKLPSDYST